MTYNLYYNYKKINHKPLSEEEVNVIRNRQFIFKIIDEKNIKIPVSKLKFTKCTIL